jgi:hypothetical protein
MSDFPGYQQALARALHISLTPEVARFLSAWQRAEGGHASYNPFNTTQGAPGASRYNPIGVRNYPSAQAGIQATVQTLLSGRYAPIVNLLRSGHASAHDLAAAVEHSPWGTGGGVLRVLGEGGGTASHDVVAGLSGSGSGTTGPAPVDPQALLQGLLGSFTRGGINTDALLRIAPMLQAARAQHMNGQPAPPSSSPTVPVPSGLGSVRISPNADRADVRTKQAVILFVRKIAGVYGKPLEIGTGSNHHQFVAGEGNTVSDHWYGEAADVPASGAALTRLGQAALIAAGADPKWAHRQTGGVFNINGYNILFNTHVGGNHFNHLHVGLGRRLGRHF